MVCTVDELCFGKCERGVLESVCVCLSFLDEGIQSRRVAHHRFAWIHLSVLESVALAPRAADTSLPGQLGSGSDTEPCDLIFAYLLTLLCPEHKWRKCLFTQKHFPILHGMLNSAKNSHSQ